MSNTPRVSIITATVGKPHLKDCIESVRAQTYKNIQHLVVVDGKDATSALFGAGFPIHHGSPDEVVMYMPYNTGKDRYNGHRIYGAATFIADGDYFIFLDDDNMLEPNHVEDLVNLVTSRNLDWAYSFRKIVDKDKNFICLDDCESLGMWSSILSDKDFFIDVNCYFLSKKVAVGMVPVWYRKFREPGQLEIDRAIAGIVFSPQNKLKYECTRDYTVQYRVGNTDLSVKGDFFLQGNKKMLEKWGGNLPWKKRE